MRSRGNRIFLDNILKNCPDGIIGSDPAGNLFLFNEEAEKIYGYSAATASTRMGSFSWRTGRPTTYSSTPEKGIVGLDVRRLLGSGQEGTWEVLAGYATRSEPGKYVESSAVSRSGKKIPFHISVSESTSGGKKFYTAIMRDVSQIKAYEEDLQILANTDGLTRLYNRRQLYPMMQKDLDRAVRRKVPFSVLLIDIDHFKKFNDTYGHAGGDLLLVSFADKMRSSLRQMDSAFRFGGEEFVVLLPETTGQDAMIPAERFRQRIADSWFSMPPDSQPVSVTVSVGIAGYRDGNTLDDVIQHADLAMYAAKSGGRNRVVNFDHLVHPETP